MMAAGGLWCGFLRAVEEYGGAEAGPAMAAAIYKEALAAPLATASDYTEVTPGKAAALKERTLSSHSTLHASSLWLDRGLRAPKR